MSLVKTNPIRRMCINADYALWKRLPWPLYMDIWYPTGRTAVGNCTECIPGGLKRYYGKMPSIIIKCLNCGHEEHATQIYGWRLKGVQQWIDTQQEN